ncbi:hypothetical protein A3D05_01970 [Candidatus Gottesmanbacteria bacterium RIFCSPHIGHO2_02_FULL_40_24]|nr:MAG: hypothetical protein A3D05_01970 [Candidatus Gottesmanbacteria bacterium RIFCSPHIGHO2_02_FULL_40_24]OGG22832.1 MAG: hypothetical protein A3B48_05595 [Candidatus Gottesmanbacteria bacterium RIFCSPLOWO2_01_FULL_40_10]
MIKKLSWEYKTLIIVIFLIVFISLISLAKEEREIQKINPLDTNLNKNSQFQEQGNVSVSIKFLSEKSSPDTLFFSVSLDTHSVDLDQFNFGKNVLLEYQNSSGKPRDITLYGGGHHRQAELSFPQVPPPYKIIIKDLAGITRREFEF